MPAAFLSSNWKRIRNHCCHKCFVYAPSLFH